MNKGLPRLNCCLLDSWKYNESIATSADTIYYKYNYYFMFIYCFSVIIGLLAVERTIYICTFL
jgi:hypothetical protein